ncbi:mitochondrial nucleoid-associated protein 1 isoform X2 [Taeniopygia guttata]|uniref:mitochondrial nucleoid-associated protein 1 isoform X2 n=1 Tax=Taeniopygia guttata TaxID=59729 RepID=UPI003BB92C7F
MAAGPGAGPELCPHCRRPFKRLRAHLPHCRAAPAASPRPGPGSKPGSSPQPSAATGSKPGSSPQPSAATGSKPGSSPQPSAATGSGPGSSPQPSAATGSGPVPSPAPGSKPGSSPQLSAATGSGPVPSPAPGPRPAAGPGTRSGSRAVRDVARSLDLRPEEVRDVPRKLQKGVKVVIEKHRARVLREKEPRSRGERTEPGPAPHPQRRETAPKSTSNERRSRAALGSGTGSSKGKASSLKAAKTLQEPAESRNSPGDLVQQEGREKLGTGGEQVRLEVEAGSDLPAGALHPGMLHLSPALGAGGRGTPRNELSLREPRAGGQRVPEPGPSAGTAPQLDPLHTPQTQRPCSGHASGSSARAGPAGLEWFPDLYPDWEQLRTFPGKRFHEDVRIRAETPKGGLAQGQRGPLWERPLMEVRLGELPSWISTCSFSPQGLLAAVHRAWSSYCAKYIHVKQGGPAGISMLLAGYCLLSYGWNYQHLKRHRWRKYH